MQRILSVEVVQNKKTKSFSKTDFPFFFLTVEKTLFIPQYLCNENFEKKSTLDILF